MIARRLLPLPALALLAVLAGCYTGEGSGVVAVRSYPVDGFTGISLDGDGDATVVAGPYAVSVSAEDNVLPSIRVERRGDRLVLGRDSDWIDGIRPTVPIEFRISMPRLDAAGVSGGATLRISGVRTGQLALRVSGGGEIALADARADEIALDVDAAGILRGSDLDAQRLRVAVGGAGRVSVGGAAAHSEVAVRGSGVYRASELDSASAAVEVEGAGQALVRVADALAARVSGKGRLGYFGAPQVDGTVVRAGRLEALDDLGAIDAPDETAP